MGRDGVVKKEVGASKEEDGPEKETRTKTKLGCNTRRPEKNDRRSELWKGKQGERVRRCARRRCRNLLFVYKIVRQVFIYLPERKLALTREKLYKKWFTMINSSKQCSEDEHLSIGP